ncbi:MAG: cysteine--tRNA ligase [Chloroflexi bacterium]|nr:cysteine--tRNA ligase [Chloroflexota bacterium]MBL75687.1 cysteine--tRNA ligase [Chloroflexota bacterium]
MKLSDTLTGEKREFKPIGDEVRIYVCGVTPYSSAHVGHAMSYIVFDVLHRYLEFKKFRVRRVQNFTDIDDKIIARANEQNISAEQLSKFHIQEYMEDMARLNIIPADIYPLATEEIPKIIQMIEGLINSGIAYESSGDVYFRVNKKPDYGKLGHRSLEMMRTSTRVEAGVEKEHSMDFALWKSAKPQEPSWDSPWGKGRPGWHIECSAMALEYLGSSIDIHGGGQDLIFPHHENEIAQTESFTNQTPFVNFWLHNGLLNLDSEKMSKSLGNLVTIRQALEKYSADAIRLSVLNAHYRSPGYYSDEALNASEKAVSRIRQAISLTENVKSDQDLDVSDFKSRFVSAMDDDLNTPQALACLFDLVREINREAVQGNKRIKNAQNALQKLSHLLGFTLSEDTNAIDEITLDALNSLIKKRSELRTMGKYKDADEVRDQINSLGIEITDTPEGTTWRKV